MSRGFDVICAKNVILKKIKFGLGFMKMTINQSHHTLFISEKTQRNRAKILRG
jgi:hypothetical protein